MRYTICYWDINRTDPQNLLSMTLDVPLYLAPLSKSVFTVTPLCVSNFSTSIFIYTSLNILNILLMFLWLPPSFAVLSSPPDHVPLCYTFVSLGHAVSPIHPYYFISSNLVRVTGHKAPGESSVNIIVSSYDTTHLQENSQRLG